MGVPMRGVIALTAFAVICLVIGATLALFSHWLTGVFWRLGATESPAAWLAYLITAFLGIVVFGSMFHYAVQGEWPWE